MKIDDMTIGELKEIKAFLDTPVSADRDSGILQRFVGKRVISRSRNAGIVYGEVVAIDATAVILKNSRRLWYHKPTEAAWYEGVAKYGLSADSKLSETMAETAIVEDYKLTVVFDAAVDSIENAPVYKR